MNNLLGNTALIDGADLGSLLLRLGVNLLFAWIVIQLIYYRLYRNRDYVFTYYLFNVITFSLCLLLARGPTQFGLALALFGVFGILRYRTEQIRIRDLTYLFVVIAIGVLNGVAGHRVPAVELVAIDTVIVGMTALLEMGPWGAGERSLLMFYDQLELLRPGNEAKLAADIQAKTGHRVLRVEIQRVDLLRDAAEITVFHREVR